MTRKQAVASERASRIEPLTRLATGGMAEIWLSREIGAAGLERLVVVKRLLPHLAREPDIVHMFVSEARFVARLVHPNVVQIHDLGEDEEGYFLVMEYVAGCSVSELLVAASQAKRHLSMAAALSIAEQACRGAHAAHELSDPTGKPLGLVHRDISPHNLMVGPSGEVKLLDFGIAKATEAAEHTRTGSLKGKHGYMSPEQCAATRLDRRSDVFALGIVAWELFTGARLFKRETEYQTMHAIVNGDIRPARLIRAELPKEVDEAILKALATDLDVRWQTAEAFRRALVSAADAHGLRPSRDELVLSMNDLLGGRLEERASALRDAAKSGQFPEPSVLRAALVHAETSAPGPGDAGSDAAATVVQRRLPAALEEAARQTEETASNEPQTEPGSRSDNESTLVDNRTPAPPRPAIFGAVQPPAPGTGDRAEGAAPRAEAPLPAQKSRKNKLAIAAAIGLVAGMIAALIVWSSGPTSGGSAGTSAGSAAAGATLSGPPLRFMVPPTVDPNVLRSDLGPFLAWLSRALGRPTELIIAQSYDHSSEAIAKSEADVALMPPLLFVRAIAREPRLQPLAVRLFDGSRASDGYLLVRDDSPLTQAKDLKGHKICYVDRASSTGFLLPRIWMRKAGLAPDKDVDSKISGDHIAAMRDLAAGNCDAAAVYSGAYLTARQEGIPVGRLRVLAITGRVPQDTVVASPGMAPDDVKALRAALLGFEPRRDIDAGRIGEVLGITGFADFQTAEFDAIREAAESEGLLKR